MPNTEIKGSPVQGMSRVTLFGLLLVANSVACLGPDTMQKRIAKNLRHHSIE